MADEQPKETPETLEPKAAERPVWPELRAGYTVKLGLKIKEGKKERVQIFEGIIIRKSGATAATKTITVRKEVKGFGVEKIIPLSMPTLVSITVVKKAEVRQAKLYYLRTSKKRLKEKMVAAK